MRFFKMMYSQDYPHNNIKTETECFCSSTNGFFITKRQASSVSAIIIFLFLCIFISGFFLGKKNAIEEFSNKVLNGSFADQARYSFYSLYGGNPAAEESEEQEYEEEQSELIDSETQKRNEALFEEIAKNVAQKENNLLNVISPELKNNINGTERYSAELIGFGTHEAAEQFVKKAQKKGYNVFIRQRKSVTSKNKSARNWYQVVTDEFDDKSKLMDLVEKIKITERLHDVKLVTK